jgi:arabinogalactan endo-1,4-beta-galactosidase
VQAVSEYTRDTLTKFHDAGVPPDMVQIGNEITHGMLWPDGKLPDHWDNFADYIRAGVKGVDAACGKGPRPKIMIHFDQGASIPKTKYFFDKLNSYKIRYDVIGFSYYPWWHGSIEDLRENLAFAAKRYGKDVYVVETAYYWKPSRYFREAPAPFPESPEGQRDFLDEVTRAVMGVPDGRGLGVFWWEPAVANRGLGARGFFDEDGNALPVIGVFDKYTRPERPTAGD